MIIKLLYLKKPGPLFPGVRYNTNKVDRNKGELMKVSNFGALQAFSNLRPQDYINYLKTLAGLNPGISKPQFHAAISGKGKLYDKDRQTLIAESWLKEMGYGNQPYLIVFHKDTDNNHVHIVSSRVDKSGRKIDSAFEKIRSQKRMSAVLGYDYAFGYKFSTRAQFFILLEQAGYLGLDPDEKQIAAVTQSYTVDKGEVSRIKGLLTGLKGNPEKLQSLMQDYSLELVFHAAEGKAPYGYTIIDHKSKVVYKGSTVLALKELLGESNTRIKVTCSCAPEIQPSAFSPLCTIHVQSIWIADDVDDQQIHGMRRRRQKKARTNTR